MDKSLEHDIDVMRDVYMTRAQREAYDRIAAIALMRGQSWQVVGYMDPDADFMLPRDGGCVLSTQLILVRTPTDRYSRPVYLPAPPKDTADEQ
jgi:hypothetical protein